MDGLALCKNEIRVLEIRSDLFNWIKRGIVRTSFVIQFVRVLIQYWQIWKLENQSKKMKNLASWFSALESVQQGISDPQHYGLRPSDIHSHYSFSMLIHSTRQDELESNIEYGILCHAIFISKTNATKVQTRWTVWKTFEDFKELDINLRSSLGWQMEKLEFPRDRKRDSFMGMRSKSVTESRQKLLSTYLQQVNEIQHVSKFHQHHGCVDLKVSFICLRTVLSALCLILNEKYAIGLYCI